ncbi:hypothetical protein [Gemmiger sp.]
MKKKLMSVTAAVAAASLVLTACGSAPSDETPSAAESTAVSTEATSEAASEAAPEATEAPAAEEDSTLAEIREANQLDAVLADSGKIQIVSTYADADGKTAFTNTGVYLKTDNGTEYREDVQVDDNHTYMAYKAAGDNAFAGYIATGDDHTLMLVDPESIDELLSFYFVPTAYGTETVTETGEQDGILMVVAENTDSGKKVADTVYCVDPETKRLVSINQTYLTDEGTPNGTQMYSFTYGDDVDADAVKDVSEEMVNAADTGTLTAVFHPGQSNEFTETYTVSKATTYINAFGGDGAVYLDAGLSDPSYGLTFDDDEMTVYVK